MPTDAAVLGFSNRWYPTAIETAQTFHIAGYDVRVVTPALFIATKLEAFHGRGGHDIAASHDLEDIIAVFTNMWGKLETDKVVGGLFPNDGDGNAWVMSPPRRTTCAHTLAPSSGSCSTIGTSPRRLLASSSRIRPVRHGARSLKVGFVRCPFPEHISCFARRGGRDEA